MEGECLQNKLASIFPKGQWASLAVRTAILLEYAALY